MKIIDFETAEPLFSQERDEEKPFTCRKFDYKDKRFRALAQWGAEKEWAIRITNPATGESFVRKLREKYYMNFALPLKVKSEWLILYLGEKV